MPPRPRLGPLTLALVGALTGCVDEVALPEQAAPAEAPVGEARRVELRFLRFDVANYEQQIGLEQLRQIPRAVLDDLWLVDYDLTESVQIVLEELSGLSPSEADALSPAAQNMRKLLNMTPDNVELEGTKLEELISISSAVGIPPARVLAALMQIGVTDRAMPFDVVAEVFLDELLGSHPAAKVRKGPVDAEHPDGLYPIAPRSLPITLGDIVYSFESLPDRFGPAKLDPADPSSPEHPGFVLSAAGITKEEFAMFVRVSLNALPYKGVDLTSSYVASVNSTASQIEGVFDFTDPDWMRVEGLSDELTISEMTVRIREHDAFVPGGASKEPAGQGDSPIWDLPPWEFERIIIEMARQRTALVGPHCDEYKLGTDAVAFEGCVDADGWVELTTFTDIGNPPPPAYFWDVLAEVAQVRLHDGGIAEGDADVEFTLRDVHIPLDEPKIVAQIKANLAANPAALTGITEQLNNNTDGDADFYYFKPDPRTTPAEQQGDWLFFVAPDDLREDAAGAPVRPYAYANPGFYADAELTKKVSSKDPLAGDAVHEKVRVAPGDALYLEDDEGRRYELLALDKPREHTLALEITRIR